MGKYFGTDGFRGEANVNLTVNHAYKIGRYLGWYFGQKKERPKFVIGKDTRRSSYMFEYSLVAGLTASGADVYLMHVTTTPSVAYITRTDDFDCGIMISASHNPYYDNGIKLI
ncbi:MAG: phosphoglucosamine mutase, partial [Clostridia bacterium]|nr:phosphoglucosamine mutase [Clostridia bacterium]